MSILLNVKNCLFFNERQSIIQVLQEEFCGGLSDLLEIPSCGDKCNRQEDSIVFEIGGNGTIHHVNFVCVINALESNLPTVKVRLNSIMDAIGSEPKRNITFSPGEISGKYKQTQNQNTTLIMYTYT